MTKSKDKELTKKVIFITYFNVFRIASWTD